MEDGRLILTTEEIKSITDLLPRLYERPENPELFCQQVKSLAQLLPSRLYAYLQQFAHYGSPSGFMLIQTLPVQDTLPPTPPSNKHHVGETTTLAAIQALCISAIAEMVAYEAECDGRLFQDIVPTKTMASMQTSMGSIELEIHTEQAFSTLRPDFLSLACIRGDPNAYTYIMPVQSILKNLSEDEEQVLREPLWTTGVDFSFKLNDQAFHDGDIRGPMAIITGTQNDPRLVFDQDLMKGSTPMADAFITKIVDIYYKERHAHIFSPGDIVIIDNRRAVHGRSSFHPKYDGYDRFLVRCFGMFNYTKTEYARKGHTIQAVYS